MSEMSREPTAILADFAATLTYGVTITVIAVFFQLLWIYASIGRRLIDEHVSDARVRGRTTRYLPGFIAYVASLPLAFVNPWIALAIYAFLAVFFLAPMPE